MWTPFTLWTVFQYWFGASIYLLNLHFCRSSWELPELRDGHIQAISDSDGVNYPWYGCTTEMYTIVGPTKRSTTLTVSMNDNFCPSVTWSIPTGTTSIPPRLSSIQRDQRFTTWLVAMNEASAEIILLRTIRWRMQLAIEVDPEKPLGQRARLLDHFAQEQPEILLTNEPIPPNALVKPNANGAQELIWRPRRGKSVVVIPPKYWVDWKKWTLEFLDLVFYLLPLWLNLKQYVFVFIIYWSFIECLEMKVWPKHCHMLNYFSYVQNFVCMQFCEQEGVIVTLKCGLRFSHRCIDAAFEL